MIVWNKNKGLQGSSRKTLSIIRNCSNSSRVPTLRKSFTARCDKMTAPKLAAQKGPLQLVAAASSSGGPVTRSKSQTFTSAETSKSFDVFGKEINASDHVTAIRKLVKKNGRQ